MPNIFKSLLKKQNDPQKEAAAQGIDYLRIASILKTDKHTLEQFETAYAQLALSQISENFFEVNAKQAANQQNTRLAEAEKSDVVERVVGELLAQTAWYRTDESGVSMGEAVEPFLGKSVEKSELAAIPPEIRPQLTGRYMTVDMDVPSYVPVLNYYAEYMKDPHGKWGKASYDRFRQGLDILNLDRILYEIIRNNQNSMGHWLPALDIGVAEHGFFKIPPTTIIQVPMTLLQLTRIDWESLTPMTMAIVDRYCQKAFRLDENKEYFVKTGTYSSKYDFRNARVTGAKEVRELGEYLLFIHYQALQMASPLNNKQIYGASTTNEWVVRDFIKDKEDNPTIYKGMPLHTEYRVFIDFDTKKIIGHTPYWDPAVMKRRFAEGAAEDSPHYKHDYIVYLMHEDVLMQRYRENVERVLQHVEEMLPDIPLSGQWSLDIMQNGNEFYAIDMGQAANSALNECVPHGLLKPANENWMEDVPKALEKPLNQKEK